MKKPAVKEFKAKSKPEYSWAVWFHDEDGKRVRRLFKSKKAANAFATDKEVKAANMGHQKAAELSVALADEAVSCQRKLTPYNRTLTQAVEHFMAYLDATSRSAPIEELVPSFIEYQTHAGKSHAYVYELKNRLGMFVADHGARFAAEITPADVSAWVHARPVAARTRNHFRRVLSAFFAWAKIQGKCQTNPARDVGKAKVITGRPEIYTPAQVQSILQHAAALPETSHDILATVLFGMFTGIRPLEAQRLTWGQVLRRGKTWRIDLSAAGTKTAKRRLLDIEEPLRSWLERFFPFATSGPIVQMNFARRQKEFRSTLAKAAEDRQAVQWIADGLRHTYASYALANSNDAAATARALGHGDTNMLFEHYAEVATPEDAKEFLALTPAAVLDSEKVIPMPERKSA